MMASFAGSSTNLPVTCRLPKSPLFGSVSTIGPKSTEAPEFAVADAIVSLDIERVGDRESRVLQVLKLRGSGFTSGKHAYRVSADGIVIFPRLADHVEGDAYDFRSERISSGVSLLDDMLSDGYWRGASTLVAGPSGSGKTLIALHFVLSGADLGEQGIYATFQENPVQLERIVQGFSWSLDTPQDRTDVPPARRSLCR